MAVASASVRVSAKGPPSSRQLRITVSAFPSKSCRILAAIPSAMNRSVMIAILRWIRCATVAKRYSYVEQLKLDRTKEREKAIREGQMADPNQPTSLNQAITPVGTCTSMCPEFERVERIVQKMVDKSEKVRLVVYNLLLLLILTSSD
jgi:ERCC4-related helicase